MSQQKMFSGESPFMFSLIPIEGAVLFKNYDESSSKAKAISHEDLNEKFEEIGHGMADAVMDIITKGDNVEEIIISISFGERGDDNQNAADPNVQALINILLANGAKRSDVGSIFGRPSGGGTINLNGSPVRKTSPTGNNDESLKDGMTTEEVDAAVKAVESGKTIAIVDKRK